MELTVDARVVHAATGGRDFDPAQPAMVFVHGAGLDRTVWALQARYFAHHGHNVLAVDLPGHGHSEGPPLASIGEIADWLVHVLDTMAWETAALVGHSLGALAALEAAARVPERVTALALLGVNVPLPVNSVLLETTAANQHLGMDLLNSWGHGHASHLGGHRAPGLWMMGGAIRLYERSADGVLHTDLAACNAYEEGGDAAAKVRCPTLLVLGDNDLLTTVPGAKALAAAIPKSKTVVVENCGHMMMAERPGEVLDALREVL